MKISRVVTQISPRIVMVIAYIPIRTVKKNVKKWTFASTSFLISELKYMNSISIPHFNLVYGRPNTGFIYLPGRILEEI